MDICALYQEEDLHLICTKQQQRIDAILLLLWYDHQPNNA